MLKRLLLLFLAISVSLTLFGCQGTPASSDESSNLLSVSSQTTAFVKPKNYASVILLTINPQFRLYLNKAGEVLAVESVNSDAESLMPDLSLKQGKLDQVVDQLLTASKDGGFVKENAAVSFEVVELQDKTVDTTKLLTTVKTSAGVTLQKLEITATVDTSVADDLIETNVSSVFDPSTTSKVLTQSSMPAHTHSYAVATCTKAATCSCGATNGKALGHQYKEGSCTRCGAKDPDYKTFSSVKTKQCKWEALFLSADANTLYRASLVLSGDRITVGVGLGDKIDPSMPEAQDAIVYQNNYYYFGRGTGPIPLKSVTENGTSVTVTDLADGNLVLTRVDENTLKVVSAPDEFGYVEEEYYAVEKIPVGVAFKMTLSE